MAGTHVYVCVHMHVRGTLIGYDEWQVHIVYVCVHMHVRDPHPHHHLYP